MEAGVYVVIKRTVGMFDDTYSFVNRQREMKSALIEANALNVRSLRRDKCVFFAVFVEAEDVASFERIWAMDNFGTMCSLSIALNVESKWFSPS